MAVDFEDQVRFAFSFLEDEEFRVTSGGGTQVTYESPEGVFVQVFHDTDDYYLGFRVGLLAEPRDALTEAETLRLADAPALDGLFPSPAARAEDDLAELARRLREYGRRALDGDPTIFAEARALREEYTRRFMRPEGL